MTFTTFGELHPSGDYRQCKCNMCEAEFPEKDILVEDGTWKEYCPNCFKTGYIQDKEK